MSFNCLQSLTVILICCTIATDLLIPITSFSYCIEGIFLVFMSMNQIAVWNIAFNLKLVEIFTQFYSMKYINLLHQFYWLPLSRINSEMEFRIYHHIFCQEYRISPSALKFDEYMQKTIENLLLRLIEIRAKDWALIICLIFINWGRNALGWHFILCHGSDYPTPEELQGCHALRSIQIYTVGGAIIFVLCFTLAFVSRMYELRVLQYRGIHKGSDYVLFLKVFKCLARLLNFFNLKALFFLRFSYIYFVFEVFRARRPLS